MDKGEDEVAADEAAEDCSACAPSALLLLVLPLSSERRPVATKGVLAVSVKEALSSPDFDVSAIRRSW